MRDQLKRHVNRVKSKGRFYYYHRKTKERLPDEANARALRVLEINAEAAKAPGRPSDGTIDALIAEYRESAAFKELKPSTKRNYNRDLDRIKEKWGKLPASGIARKHCLRFRDTLAETPRAANHLASVMSLLLAFAVDRDYRPDNPAARLGKLKSARTPKRWSDEDWRRFHSAAPAEMYLAGAVAIYTGQRQGDVLLMKWSDIDKGMIRVIQGKTDWEGYIPVHADLASVLGRVEKRSVYVVTDAKGRPYKGRADTFRHDWRSAILAAGLDGLTFHGLRHAAATRLAEAGCTEKEIMAITGHQSPEMVKRYTTAANQKKLAKSAIQRLERGELD